MKTSLLQIPNKTTDEVNWYKPLNHYLTSVYGHSAKDYAHDITGFSKLRQDIRGAHPDATGISMMIKYYSQLELLDLRVPFASAINTPSKNRVEFSWTDSFDPSITNSQGSLAFEKANVLYNLGSLLSKQAAIKLSNGNLKDAIAALTQGAGVFEFIGENFLHAPSPDLALAMVKFLHKLLVTEAQELFALQAISTDAQQKMNQLVAKLCSGVAESYEVCLNEAQPGHGFEDIDPEDFLDPPEDMTDVGSMLEPRWRAILDFKRGMYLSLTWYYQGLHLEAQKKYGDAIAYLTRAQSSLDDDVGAITKAAADQKISLPYDMLDYYQYQQDAVKIKLADLTKDNDLIYHDLIPPVATIPLPSAKVAVEATPFAKLPGLSKISDDNYHHFLANVVPVETHELLSFYSEEKSQLLRNELDHVDVSESEVASAVSSLGLPTELYALKKLANSTSGTSSGDIDEDTLRKASEIASHYHEDQSNRAQIDQMRKQIYTTIQRLPPSEDATKLKRAFYQASTNDTQVFGLVSDQELFDILGRGQVAQLFAPQKKPIEEEMSLLDLDDSALASAGDPVTKAVAPVEATLAKLDTVKASKHKVIADFKQQIHEDDISDILVLNMQMRSIKEIKSVIFAEELKKFDGVTNEIDELVEQEKQLVATLTSQWQQVCANREIAKLKHSSQFQAEVANRQRQRIHEFYPKWRQYHQGLKSGASFYPKLQQWGSALEGIPASSSYQPAPGLAQCTTGATPMPRPPQKQPTPSSSSSKPSLIYDQPSTYQADTYQFFNQR